MKKNVLFAVAIVGMLVFTNCEKEQINQNQTVVKAEGKQRGTPASYVSISVAAGTFCGYIFPNVGVTAYTNTKVNSISVTNNTQSYFPNLVYTFYKKVGNQGVNIELFEPLPNRQYTSGDEIVGLAHSSLTNGAKILVIANETSSSGPSLSANLKLNTQFNTLWNMDGTAFTMPSMYDFKTVILGNRAGELCSGGDTN